MFKRGVIKLEDLSAGMELTGTVLNVVDFGCFVDIGMHDSGLVHVSRLADKYVRDPHDVVAVGDIVKVWVVEIDKERRRVSLTMVRPGSERPKYPQRGPKSGGGRPAGGRPAGEGDPSQGEQQPRQRPPRAAGQQRPVGRHGPRANVRRAPRANSVRRVPAAKAGRRDRKDVAGRRTSSIVRLPQPRPTPKPVIPITEAMKTGKEPLRTFGDLMQFYQHKTVEPSDNKPPAAEPAPAEAVAAAESPAVVSEPVAYEPIGEAATTAEPVVPELPVVEAVVNEGVADEPAIAEPPASDQPPAAEQAPAEKPPVAQ